ncbi:Crp/Fnr family transcriptional regulator [Planomonospora parontospora subsp. parontospora]|uniref:Crp/Fnr family transcriptional regulator n=2 Tax=Planomonospora parontospora TaxID=58119 RepID=A0AA37BLI2_9ACTN|nr:Crp/Fnr family transcriptional regulator [Planomonospora parontospora]GGK86857.1 Crp/Fnr family transcriptional regulator [Planomonospora parontospora]GII10790.1 Crp/Fnr family transcriptional regulator [Planomonospora parontospora subsp. parontospora]
MSPSPSPSVSEPGEFLSLLTPEEAAGLRTAGRPRRWDRGATLMAEGDASDWVLVLTSGRVKISSHTSSGTEVVLAVRGPGALLGEFSAIDGLPRSATVTALEPVEGIAVRDFPAFLREHGRVAVLLLQTVTGRVRDADRKRIEYGAFDTAGRVATRLLELAERYGEQAGGAVRVALPLSQDELAGWTGSSREAVSKALRSLRDRGLIETGRRRVVIHDMEGLRRRAR